MENKNSNLDEKNWELEKIKKQMRQLEKEKKHLQSENDKLIREKDELEYSLNAIRNSISWRIIVVPGKLYKRIRHILHIIVTLFQAVNITNCKFLFSAFKNGGIRQVIFELKAYKLRLEGKEEIIIPPVLIKSVQGRRFEELEKINIPDTDNPKVSIIIPAYNQFVLTYDCIKSIVQNSEFDNYEVILADDFSNDDTIRISEVIDNIHIVRNQSNLKFLLNCNNAAKHARGEYILFLNNDTQVMQGWLTPLIEVMDKDRKVGIVGAKLIYPDGKLQEAGGIVWKDASAWNYGNGQNPLRPEFNYLKEVDFISGAAIMTRRDLWEQIGGFDKVLAPAYYEDVDYAFNVRKHGYKVVYQPLSQVIHFEGKSNGTDVKTGIKSYQVENQQKFYIKWKTELENKHFDNGTKLFVARDRSAEKKHILLIDHYVPRFDMDSGSKCTYMYLQQFVRMGMQVTFIGDNFAVDEPYSTMLQQSGIEVLHGNYYMKHWKEWLYTNGEYFDYVYTQRPHIAPKYIETIRKCTEAKLFYFDVDLVHLRENREYEITHDEKVKKSSEHWKKIEMDIFDEADVIHVVGSYEEEYLNKIFPYKKIRNIPIFIYDDEIQGIEKDFSKRHDIVFVGGFAHPPNLDAVEWFASEIFPKVLQKYPRMKWHIVGSNPPEELLKLASDNIIIEGFMSDDDLAHLYKSCRLAVVPLRYGAGVKGKIVEAAYYQIPMVTTSIGAEGIPSDEGTMVVCDTADGFADSICNLYDNVDLLRNMSDNGKAFIAKHYSLKAVEDILKLDMTV